MGRLGTDVLALACIVGGAAVGGAVTLGALEARDAETGWEADAGRCRSTVVVGSDLVVDLTCAHPDRHHREIRVLRREVHPRVRADAPRWHR